MKIAIMVEGTTEKAFMPKLREYLTRQIPGRMPNLDLFPYNGRVPKGDQLKRDVLRLLNNRFSPADHVIALTDVYTGNNPPDFVDATDARNKMRLWVGAEPRFHPHATQYDFEAWLLPYWEDIQRLAGHNKTVPSADPESVNHTNPPSSRIKDIFQSGNNGGYVKRRDAQRILRDNDLSIAISKCSELKAFINTILTICGAPVIP